MTIVRSYPTPRGGLVRMAIREDTVDEPVINSTAMHDEYGLGSLSFEKGDLALDVGAYVGSVGCAIAADWPDARVVMVEAVPENVAVIRQTIAENGWDSRVEVYNAAATAVPGEHVVFYGAPDDATDFMRTNRYVGGLLGLRDHANQTANVPNLSLTTIVDTYGPVAVMKIDCEGCEYPFLADPAISQVAYIIGEYHRGYDRLAGLLVATHDVTKVSVNPDDDNFGIFTAWRRGGQALH